MKILIVILGMLFSFKTQAAFFVDTDIPMMDGTVVQEKDTFSFDTPAGQIMSISCRIPASKKEVQDFYRESLSALGWQARSSAEYVRDQDILSLKMQPTQKGTQLQIQLTYKNK